MSARLSPHLLATGALLALSTGCLLNDHTYEGTAIITSDRDVARLAGIEYITGDLVIDGASVTSVRLPDLYWVGGAIRIEDNPQLTTLQLVSVAPGGDLTIAGNGVLATLSLAAVDGRGGDIAVRDNPAMTTLDLVANDVRDVDIADNAALAYVTVHGRGTASITVARNPVLRQVSAVHYEGALSVRDQPAMQTLDLNVERMTALTIERCAALLGLDALRLEAVGDLRVEGNASLLGIGLPAMTRVSATLRVVDNPKLSRCSIARLLEQLSAPPAVVEQSGNSEVPCAIP